MTLDHQLIQIFLETTHVTPVQVVGSQVHTHFLALLHIGVIKHLLRLIYGRKQLVARGIQLIDITEFFLLQLLLDTSGVVELHQVFRQNESVVEYEPKALFGLVFFASEDTADAL